ncbi:ECF transporter S component [Lactiplantibacillus plantarum]|uniref:ECF transporter S component n=1 Tax=Lactiplantibacillus plantarum TaxID=1590 RepID=UPI0021CB69F6|nr:hypothetical protein [Lactiplantibacillus plantarum]
MQHTTLHRLVGIALLGAISYILMLLEFPILPVAPWMKIDFSDIPIGAIPSGGCLWRLWSPQSAWW